MAEYRTAKLIILFALIVFSFSTNHSVNAESEVGWDDLNRTSESILQYVKQQHYEEAGQALEQFSEEFLKLRLSHQSLSMRELQVITTTFDETSSAVKSASMTHSERVRKAYALRLLTDIYTDSSEPLWKKTEKTLLERLVSVKESVEMKGQPDQQQLTAFTGLYAAVEPAWQVSLETTQFQRVYSQMKFLDRLAAEDANEASWVKHFMLLETTFAEIYDGEPDKDDVTDPSFYWFVITVASAVISSLTYAGWKKYRAHQAGSVNKVKQRKRGL